MQLFVVILLNVFSVWQKIATSAHSNQRRRFLTTPVEKGEQTGEFYLGPRDVWDPRAVAQKNIKHTRMPNLKNQKFSSQRSPARMFPRAPLWLSICLCLTGSQALVNDLNDETLEVYPSCKIITWRLN